VINKELNMDYLTKAIEEAVSEDNKISCSQALKIAENLGMSPSKIGNELDRKKIKVKQCQLGCFK